MLQVVVGRIGHEEFWEHIHISRIGKGLSLSVYTYEFWKPKLQSLPLCSRFVEHFDRQNAFKMRIMCKDGNALVQLVKHDLSSVHTIGSGKLL